MAKNPRIEPVERATGISWETWLDFMDGIGARDLDHHAIAVKVYEDLDGKVDNTGWWAQAVTIAYEQEIGRRLPGQRSDGTFQTSVSKSTALTMQQLIGQWTDFARSDKTVQSMISDEPRVSGTEKRAYWKTRGIDGSDIHILSEPKKNGTASLVIQLMGLDSPQASDAAKQQWSEILTRFVSGIRPPA